MANHDDVARRWVQRCLGDTRSALKSSNLLDRGDQIFSYGNHFEIGRIQRDRKGAPIGFLLNGNTFSVTTSRHQSAVRSAVRGQGYPVTTIPYAAMQEAGIDMGTVSTLDVQSDWNTTTTITRDEEPRRDYESTNDDMGGWINSLTGEFFARLGYWGAGSAKPKVTCDHDLWVKPTYRSGVDWDEYRNAERAYESHIRFAHGEWEEVPASRRKTGRFQWVTGKYVTWDAVDIDGTVVWQRDVHRHWLGASLIRAAVIYRVNQRCRSCAGTGQTSPWFTIDHRASGLGPLDESGMSRNTEHFELQKHRFEQTGHAYDDGSYVDYEPPQHWAVAVANRHTECRACSGRGRVPSTRRRWTYFLSGFDTNEARPSYFFCELPPRVHPTTVSEAYETLKPTAVKLAEQMGRDVKRQGDIFAIPMPRLDLRTMKKFGGTHIRRPKLIDIDGRATWDGPRPTLLGTNHEATETVLYEGQTYARGTIVHNPAGRRPDHKRTPLGKQWHLVLKNTVPIGA